MNYMIMLCLMILLVLSLSACGNDSELEATESIPETTAEVQAEEPPEMSGTEQ